MNSRKLDQSNIEDLKKSGYLVHEIIDGVSSLDAWLHCPRASQGHVKNVSLTGKIGSSVS